MESSQPLVEQEMADSVRLKAVDVWKTNSSNSKARKILISQLSSNYFRLLVLEDDGSQYGLKGTEWFCWTTYFLKEPFLILQDEDSLGNPISLYSLYHFTIKNNSTLIISELAAQSATPENRDAINNGLFENADDYRNAVRGWMVKGNYLTAQATWARESH